jgi:hypothetical protein
MPSYGSYRTGYSHAGFGRQAPEWNTKERNLDTDPVIIKSMLTLSTLCTTIPAIRGETVMYQIQPAANSRMQLAVEKTGLLSGRKHLFTFGRF